jgi:membrane protein DedA with SNARE-associated domain
LTDLIADLKGLVDAISLHTVEFVETAGTPAVMIAMALESACIPIPSEVVMPFAGYMAHLGKINFTAAVLAGTVGCTIGSMATYVLGRYLTRAPLFSGIYKGLSRRRDYQTGETWLRKYGDQVAFTSRLLPVVRTFISLPAGVARLSLLRFSILTFIGSLVWCWFLAYIGLILGKNWDSILSVFDKIHIYILGLLVLSIGAIFFKKAASRSKK